MVQSDAEYVFLNQPAAKELNIEYKSPPAPSNPVFRGLPLYYLAQLYVLMFGYFMT